MRYKILQKIIYIFLGILCGSLPVLAVGLSSSTPQPNQTLPAGNQMIILKYDQKFDPFRVRVILVDKTGEPILIPATATLDHKQVNANYVFKAGDYTLEWHVWTWDNKESSGSIPFHVVGTYTDHSNANLSPAPATNGQRGNDNVKQAPNN